MQVQVQVQVHIVDKTVHMKTLKLNCPTVRAVLVTMQVCRMPQIGGLTAPWARFEFFLNVLQSGK